MKHLNPRQGITILSSGAKVRLMPWRGRVKHLNPRQGITISCLSLWWSIISMGVCVKHLNPRQGITIGGTSRPYRQSPSLRVKHLNPRQGITILRMQYNACDFSDACETPKSPPGDYNRKIRRPLCGSLQPGVKHLNPRQGITIRRSHHLVHPSRSV